MKAIKTHGEIDKIVDILTRYTSLVQKEADFLPVKNANTLISKLTKQSTPAKQEYLEELRESNCVVGDRKEILKDEKGNLQFTAERAKAIRSAYKEFLKQPVEVHYNQVLKFSDLRACLSDEILAIIPDIDDEEIELLNPFYSFDNVESI